MVSGLIKLIYPDGVFEKADVEKIFLFALEMRRCVKEQLKKIGGISQSISLATNDFVMNVQDMNGIGMTSTLSLPTMIALCSTALNKPVLPSLVILGDITIGGSMVKVDHLANCLQVAKDAGAKKVLVR